MAMKHYGIYADEEEQERLEFLKSRFKQKTQSAALRAAIVCASDAEGYCAPKNVSNETKNATPTKGEHGQ